jgi:hypothetical protein
MNKELTTDLNVSNHYKQGIISKLSVYQIPVPWTGHPPHSTDSFEEYPVTFVGLAFGFYSKSDVSIDHPQPTTRSVACSVEATNEIQKAPMDPQFFRNGLPWADTNPSANPSKSVPARYQRAVVT